MKTCARIAGSHHERYDGSGYPRGLQGDDIPIEGRIIAIADVFDALASKRVYKEAWDLEAVLRYIREQSGKQFDPEIVDAFFRAGTIFWQSMNGINRAQAFKILRYRRIWVPCTTPK